MPAFTINIAHKGSALKQGGTAAASHMWFELDSGNADDNGAGTKSFGWGAIGAAPGSAAGEVLINDSQQYQHKSYVHTINISHEQYQRIQAFAHNPFAHGFSPLYHPLNNNCIDYTRAALRAGGLNAAAFADRVWPASPAQRITGTPADQGDTQPENRRDTSIDTVVSELFRHSQILATEFWKTAIFTAIRDNYSNFWQQQWWRVDHLLAPRRDDPLVLDLDGNGIETIGLTQQPVLFDHNNDGVKTGTGWINPGEGFLVLDRNGNGVIDNGSELFGDNTPLGNELNGGNGSNAANGFQALAAQDSNRDGVVDAKDANWHQLRVWRDLNQDGVSQADELFTLTQLEIVSLAVAGISHLETLFDNNQIADQGHYTKANGRRGYMADVNFEASSFFRQFSDNIAVNAAVARLPDVAGSGKVRDLRQAAMQSATLRATLSNYSTATTRHAQRALLDQLLSDWADTSGMAHTLQERVGERYRIMWQTGNGNGASASTQGVFGLNALENKLRVIEAFYGRHFVELDNNTGAAIASQDVTVTEGRAGRPGTITVDLPARQLNFLDRTYALLQESVYGALLAQTRFKSLFDTVSAHVRNGHIEMDFSTIERHFSAAIIANHKAGLEELIDFFQHTTNTTDTPLWRADLMLARQLHQLTSDEKESLFSEFGISGNRRSKAVNQILTDAEQRTFRGNQYRNLIIGNASDNWLYGGGHHDLLDGSSGNDFLQGGGGDDIYLLRRGSGHDVINNFETAPPDSPAPSVNGIDTVMFDDVHATDIRSIRQEFDDMILQYGEHDSLTIQGGFGNYRNEIERFHFADGTVLSTAQLVNSHGIAPYHLSNDDDFLSLSRYNDTLYAGAGHDVIDGADGNDLLHGEDGNDLLFGGNGEDYLEGGNGDDLLIGGAGDDLILAGPGTDVLAFNQGHGMDVVEIAAGSTAAISLGFGITDANLAFDKVKDDLILSTGANDKIAFVNWYANADRRGVVALQAVTADGNAHDQPATSATNNIRHFDFAGLVRKFDEIRAAEPGGNRWALSSALAQYSHGGSDIAALGGERAYRYARNEHFLRPTAAFDPSPASLSGLNLQNSATINGSDALTRA